MPKPTEDWNARVVNPYIAEHSQYDPVIERQQLEENLCALNND